VALHCIRRYPQVSVWTLGHAVREIERSHQRVVVEETPTIGVAIAFTVLTAFILVVFRSAIGAFLALWPVSLGLYSSVRSSFTADRNRRILLIERRVFVWTFERVYEAEAIDRVYVRDTIKGSGLALRFKSGRSKDLTMSLGAGGSLNSAAAALNHFLCTPHRV
jgi:hypothetical protein